MKKIFLILPPLLFGAAHAGSMCVPKIATNQSFSHIPSANEDGNRGYFALGTSCVGGTTICKNTLVRGESHCSAAPFMPADNWETNGGICYCRFTQVRAPNGYLASRSGGWVYHFMFDSASTCSVYCSDRCGNRIRGWKAQRRAMFVAPLVSE